MFNCVKLCILDAQGYRTLFGIFKDIATAEYVRDTLMQNPASRGTVWKIDWTYIEGIGF